MEQTLRFLWDREPHLESAEIVLVAHDKCPDIETPFTTNRIDLKLDTYRKPLMCNVGVDNCKYDDVVLLDSDRILPPHYFYNTWKMLRPGMIISARRLYQLTRDHSDEQIEHNRIKARKDYRANPFRFGSKNLFSGNTFIKKHDYIKIGWMDEQFYGHGYADNDMTITALRNGLTPHYVDAKEFHLFHNVGYMDGDYMISEADRKVITGINIYKLCKKHNLKVNKHTTKYINEAGVLLSAASVKYANEFIAMSHSMPGILEMSHI